MRPSHSKYGPYASASFRENLAYDSYVFAGSSLSRRDPPSGSGR